METSLERVRPRLTLDPGRVIETIAMLQRRVTERFPGAGLGAVCSELLAVAKESSARAQAIARRHVLLRFGLVALSVAGIALLAWILSQLDFSRTAADSVYTVFQGIEAVANLVVLTGGTLLFMITIEQRLKRRRALSALHELRAIVHVIDMHQLTKDPSAAVSVGGKTPSSPARTLTPYELSRYLDYCSEMMSLTSKVAVLFAQSLPDPVVTEAVSDIERIASGMAQKVWQKIMMLDPTIRSGPESAKVRSAPAAQGFASEDV
ncbi:MAG: hypothetical protein J2P50_01245 [Hyphomicrobiaceae bacterium]|nr:hypothetical protein [Hyphomicrobiaceae bacterium]